MKRIYFQNIKKNDLGHGIEHIKYVIFRSLKFANQFKDINLNMVYAIACFHDVAHHIDKDNHEIISAKVFYEDENMKIFFSDEQRKIIKEAIEDHRASLEYDPRSDYGKIISSADRSIDINSSLKRTHAYTLKHYPNFTIEQMIDRAYNHIEKKFGKNGYAKLYVVDEDYQKLKEEVLGLLNDKVEFATRYMEVNQLDKSLKVNRKGDRIIINSNTQKTETIGKTSILKISRVSFSDYDFIRLFLAYLRKNGEIFFDRECLPYDLYPFILGGYEVLFQDIAIKEQIEGNYLEIQEALQKASLGGIMSAHDCGPNDSRRLVFITEEESNFIIGNYDENICSKMEELVKLYLKDRHMCKMIAEDFRKDDKINLEENSTPTRILKKTDAERLAHISKMIRKDFEEDK